LKAGGVLLLALLSGCGSEEAALELTISNQDDKETPVVPAEPEVPVEPVVPPELVVPIPIGFDISAINAVRKAGFSPYSVLKQSETLSSDADLATSAPQQRVTALIAKERATKVGCASDVYEQGPLAGQAVMVWLFDKTFVPRYRTYNMFSLPEQEHTSYTDRHNEHREKHYQNKGLYFNEILQPEAQDFADILTKLGLWRHSTGVNEQNPELKDQGENLHLGGGCSSISGPIDSFYNNEVNNLVDAGVSGRSVCKDNKVCGHMTQVTCRKRVWLAGL
jgi:hypothetical protein